MDPETAKRRVIEEIDRRAEVLVDLAHDIHAHPELCYEESYAHGRLCDLLVDEGFAVDRAPGGLDTAFRTEVGEGRPRVAVLCEYDALPDIGHACGHNIIGAAGLGAGLATATVVHELGGGLVVLGTPAEEGGGGKIRLLDGGAFDGLDAAMMVHPAGLELTAMSAIAVDQVHVEYRGVPAHAAAAPEEGRNALDAAVLGYLNVAALRQHIGPAERIHGIFTHGGDKPNVVPARAAMHWYVRSPTLGALASLRDRVGLALEAGASAAGCEVELDWRGPVYAEMVEIPSLLAAYRANAHRLGREPHPPAPGAEVVGSTDMGNVSQRVPSIHPMIAAAPADVAIHTPAFADAAVSEAADRAVLDGAKALAMTVVDLWGDTGLAESAGAEHRSAVDQPA